MKTLTIKLETLEEVVERAKTAATTRQYQGSFLTFGTYNDFARVITGNRLRMLNTLVNTDEGLTVRGLADKLGRNLRAVHDDLKALESYGLVVNERGNIHVPYDDLHIDVHIRRAA
ncbi:HTH domain-containing protein [Marinihelvus fidelis]|uniref:HTH domain-containing protein n=1 Tax=Marinihelvus fidelis TaxID=2613842 RepID=A0A5N0T4X9_9GAMM|nr:HTH domain-containing protein [Marinihelvus fidelis]KAA9129891.1 HTH domain-containing protein [Marinihelvus fidelis]